jgi:eukaryotic-like serine/threonine-protein kinase
MSESQTPVGDRATESGASPDLGVAGADPAAARPPAEKIIGGRYRLGSRRGIGLDIAIFEAVDMVDGRLVAVKIIHPEICATPDFAERFTTTIEQVMRARHPNLVEVLGAGAASWNDQPVHYVVCENLNGGSLRDLGDRGRTLSPSQGVMVALDVCRGLDVAHRAGLLHGDIRPGNLVFGDDGRLRIADLGLASLVAAEVSGDTVSIDRARYASPEQAMRTVVGPKTDVYSLCLCIIEAVTGVLPFVGDSTVATLSNRVDRLMPVSADLGPLAAVLERAGRPEPADRYSASEFGRALVQAAERLPRPAPIALMSSGLFAEAPAMSVEPTTTLLDATAPMALPVTSPAQPDAPAVSSPADPSVDAETPVADATAATVAVPPPPPQPDAPAPLLRERGSRRKLFAVVAVLLVAAALGGALAWVLSRESSNAVPELVGLQQGEALNMISEFGWDVVVSSEASDDVAVGVVIDTEPAAGTMLDRGDDFALTISSGPAPRVLPELTGLTVEQATAALATLDLDLQLRDQPFSEEVPAGVIVAWSVPAQPSLVAGDTVLPNTAIVVSVSAGPQPRIVPDLTGFSLVDASAQLEALGLVVVAAPDEFSDLAAGAVMRQDPVPGTSVGRGDPVTLVLSKGPDLVVIPALADFTLQQATDALTAAGLAVGAVKGDPAGVVVLAEANGVALAAATQLPRGTPIDLTLEVPAPPSSPAV